MTVRLAFATSDGAVVDQHFGRADRFEIWDVSREGARRVGARLSLGARPSQIGGSQGIPRIPGPAHAQLPDVISDCAAVFVAQIGQGAVAALQREGKRAFVAPGRIDQIIRQVSQGPLLDDLERTAGEARASVS